MPLEMTTKFYCNGHMDWPDDIMVHVLSETASDLLTYSAVEACGCRISVDDWIDSMEELGRINDRLRALPDKEKEVSRAFHELYELGFLTHKDGDHYFMGDGSEEAWRHRHKGEPTGGFDEPIAESIRKENLSRQKKNAEEEERERNMTPEERAERDAFFAKWNAEMDERRKQWKKEMEQDEK